MLEELKKHVCEANCELYRRGIVLYTWGNVSGIDRVSGLVVIKPSGVDYSKMDPEDMVVGVLESGRVVEGRLNPSSDTATHLELYKAFSGIGGITHTHSVNAVAFAQAGMDIPALGTTHADYFYGSIPCTRELSELEVRDDYERNTGSVITECFIDRGLDPIAVPGIIVKHHGPFCWGGNAAESVFNAVILETIAEMTLKSLLLNPNTSMPHYILNKHYYRKHGPESYYGQKIEKGDNPNESIICG